VEFLVTLLGHIDETRRPDGFPKVLRQVFNFKVDTREELADAVSQATRAIIVTNGMLSQDDPDHLDATKFTTNRMWVPMHMITHIRAEVKDVHGESPAFDKDGKLVTRDGKEVMVN